MDFIPLNQLLSALRSSFGRLVGRLVIGRHQPVPVFFAEELHGF